MKCDGYGATLTIGKSQTGYIFGGVAWRNWNREANSYLRDGKSCIFSWTNPAGVPFRLVNINPDHGMYSHSSYGPTFGQGHDLHISDNSNSNTNSYNNVNNAFRCAKDQTGCNAGVQWFGTSCYNFYVSDYEVFQVKHTSPSSILNNAEFGDLKKLVRFNRFRLCYRMTRDDTYGGAFHERCNYMKNTLAIVQSEHGYVMGGYTKIEWQNRNNYAHDPDAFIFTLKSPAKTQMRFYTHNKGGTNAIYDHSSYGPTFGAHDLHVADRPEDNRNSHTSHGASYTANPAGWQPGRYSMGSNDNNFRVVDYEVFQVSGLFSASLTVQLERELLDMLAQSAQGSEFQRAEYQLLWRATEHGFSTGSFHARVDNHQKTIVVIKATTGAIFGGYTSLQWNYGGSYQTDNYAFLFSLVSPSNTAPYLLPVTNTQYGIYTGNSGYTVCWGGGHDICLVGDSHSSTSSYSNIGHSFTKPNGLSSTSGANYMIGAYNFQTVEIEVFHVIFPLLSATEFENLKNLLGFQDRTFESLYRGSRDGFENMKMHGMVNGHENILYVVKSTTGYIFGAYHSIPHRVVSGWNYDETSFMWTLTNPSNTPMVIPQKAGNTNSNYFSTSYVACFGDGHDFYLTGNCNSNTNCYTSCGSGYECANGNCGSACGTFIHGSSSASYQMSDIEIFTLD